MKGGRAAGAEKMVLRKQVVLLAAILASTFALWPQTPPTGKHTFTVKITYDFRATPACSKKVQKNCVTQFNVYDLSAGYKHRTKLFSIPVEKVSEAGVKEFNETSPLILFESGKHLIGVSAQTPDNVESDPRLCKTWMEIP